MPNKVERMDIKSDLKKQDVKNKSDVDINIVKSGEMSKKRKNK